MFIHPAFAQAVEDAPVEEPGILVTLMPFFLILLIFYFMVLRPQNKRIQEHKQMVNDLRKGDRVVTQGGLIATVKKLAGEDEVVLELNTGVQVRAMRTAIISNRSASVQGRTPTPLPANDKPDDKAGKDDKNDKKKNK